MQTFPEQGIAKKFSFRSSQQLLDSQKKQTYLELVLTFITILFFGIFALKPTFTTIATLLGDINTFEEVNGKLREKIDSLATAQQILNENREKLFFLEEAIPTAPFVAMFTAQIDKAMEDTDFELDSIEFGDYQVESTGAKKTSVTPPTPETTVQSGDWDSVKFSILGMGKYDSILSFTSKLVALRRVVIIDSISIDYGDLKADGDLPKVTINGVILYQPKKI